MQDEFQRAWNEAPNSNGQDPNTGLAPQQQVPTIGEQPQVEETYEDAWAKDPAAAPPVRTWVDPAARDTPGNEFVAAWHDTPVESIPAAGATPLQDAAQAAAPAMAAASTPEDLEYGVSYQGQTGSDPGMATVYDKATGLTVGTFGDDLRQRLANNGAVKASQLQEWGFMPKTAAAAPATATTPATPPAPTVPAAAPVATPAPSIPLAATPVASPKQLQGASA